MYKACISNRDGWLLPRDKAIHISSFHRLLQETKLPWSVQACKRKKVIVMNSLVAIGMRFECFTILTRASLRAWQHNPFSFRICAGPTPEWSMCRYIQHTSYTSSVPAVRLASFHCLAIKDLKVQHQLPEPVPMCRGGESSTYRRCSASAEVGRPKGEHQNINIRDTEAVKDSS